MRAPEFDPEDAEDSASWREQLALRLTRAFALLFAASTLIAATMLEDERARVSLVVMGIVATLLVAVPALTGRPQGRVRAWLIVAPAVGSALLAFARIGFLGGPAVVLTMTLMLTGLLLGRSAMVAVSVVSFLAVCSIAWAMVHSLLPAPDPRNIDMTQAVPWMRTLLVTYLAIAMFGSLLLTVITRMERSLERARSETQRRELAESARAEAEIGALEARQLETVGRLAAGVAHDFNNNLTAIMGCAQLLEMELPADSSAQELVASIAQSSQRAADLTRQLLVYSRKAQMLLAPTDLHRLIEEAAGLVRRSGDPRVSLELELNASSAVVAADATLLQSALLNLMLNARDAMPEGGRLTVVTTSYELLPGADAVARGLAPGPCVLLEVLDTGAGIPAEVLPQIFEPFFTTKPVGRGSGLGLAAVAGAIKSHGGTIAVETELGSGTAFRVLLPLVQSTESQGAEVSAQVVYGRGELMVVDDEPAVRNTVVATLRSLGYTVSAAPDGPTAIEAVKKERERYDLVLLDLRMPHMTGETTFGKLRELSPSLRILIWSGYGAGQDVSEMLRRGAVGFIQKPYRVAELSRLIATCKRS